jgi:hypothetical protein
MMEPCNIGNLGDLGRSLIHVDDERDLLVKGSQKIKQSSPVFARRLSKEIAHLPS